MLLLNPAEIKVRENRMRKKFDATALEENYLSIKATGLIHAPTVEIDDEGIWLLAGERRLRNLRRLCDEGETFIYDDARYPDSDGRIPFTQRSDLSEVERKTLEYEENACRVDLDFQERVRARALLHELRIAQEALKGHIQTLSDTATEIAGYPAPHVRTDIQLAKYLDDPDVAKAKTQKEAIKILERKQRQIVLEELAQRNAQKQSRHELHNCDAVEFMRTLRDSSVDIILTDPPYGINMHKNNTQSGSTSGIAHEYEDTFEAADRIIRALAIEGARFCKPDAHIYMFCDIKLWPTWADRFRAAGWYVWPVPMIWRKRNAGSLLGSANGPRHVYETILFAQRGNKHCKVADDVIETVAGDADLHAANKPYDLLANLLERSATPGDVIFDACAGSGSIFAPASAHHCRVIAAEKSPAHYATAHAALHA